MTRCSLLRIAVFGAVIIMLAGKPAESVEPLYGQDSKVYFAAIGELHFATLSALQDYYQQKFGLAIEALPPISLDDSVMDPEREQAVAEELIALLKRHNPLLANEPKAILIGITDQDMYIRSKEWRFAFSYRHDRHSAVISTARMHLPSYAEASAANPQDAAHFRSPHFQSRVRKVITKTIGMLYYGMPVNSGPRSVLYKGIMGIDELDTVGEDF